jgi:translation initiation factor IF-3
MTINTPYKPPYKPPSRPAQRGPNRPEGRKDDGPRVNEDIRADKIRVVDADGEMKGVMSVREALRLAEEAGLDLVEISPNAEPPVCKILDYGKYKYEQQKKAAEARKNQKIIDIKEIKLRPGIEEHDYGVKLRNARRFLEEGDKVKVTMRFRGREMAHQEIGMNLLRRMQADLKDLSKTEQEPKFEGRQVIMVLSSETPKV